MNAQFNEPLARCSAATRSFVGRRGGATPMIRTKSVHSPIDRHKDGLRILATRGHGRGLRANRYDVWMANLGPSEDLMDAARNGRITWGEFSRRYRKELKGDGSIDLLRRPHFKELRAGSFRTWAAASATA